MKSLFGVCLFAVLCLCSASDHAELAEDLQFNCSQYQESQCIAIQKTSDCEWCGSPGAACINNSTIGPCVFPKQGAYATWNGQIIAKDPSSCILVEGNYYFPPSSIAWTYFALDDGYHTHCPWKGEASYYNVTVGGETNDDCAWSYIDAWWAAQAISGYVAFWNGVVVTPIHV